MSRAHGSSQAEVVRAFMWRALEATRTYNCVTGFIPAAIAQAEALDAMPAAKRKSLPLFGLPISLKENIMVCITCLQARFCPRLGFQTRTAFIFPSISTALGVISRYLRVCSSTPPFVYFHVRPLPLLTR